ncbi:MAG: hypothetical protein GY950_33070 [bacterium]|nr:hypothetical protein [bacterium]
MNVSKKLMMMLLIGMLTVILSTNVYSVINCNGAGGGYGDGGGGGEKSVGTDGDIETYIVEGAGYYLAANTGVQALLRLVELQDVQGLDTGELAHVLDIAAVNIKKAVETYEKLIDAAEATPYNPLVQTALKEFDYNSFMITNRLNWVLFIEVKGFLQKGDINGVFRRTHAAFTRISAMLDTLGETIDQDKLPDIPLLLRLNEACAESSLFGSYVARVFAEIR